MEKSRHGNRSGPRCSRGGTPVVAECASRLGGAVRFTLIELLVVLTIIALLAAMILPAVGRAKARSWQAECMNHLYQLHIANRLYMEENDSMYARGHSCDLGGNWGGGTFHFWVEDVAPYLGQLDMSGCPAVRQDEEQLSWHAADGREYGLTYNINFVNRWMLIAPPIRQQDVVEPSGTVELVDGQGGCMHLIYLHTDLNPTPGDPFIKIRFRHNKKLNVMHFDGHVAAVESTRYEWWTLEKD